MNWIPQIDLQKCNGCGQCVEGCEPHVLTLQAGQAALLNPAACSYCATCESICPHNAIALPYLICFTPKGKIPMDTQKTLDVRSIPPRERHPQIFALFDSLEAGEGFILINDHDPKPLYYQFLHERPDLFTWEYLLEGPVEWQVEISAKE
jgi:uncharacterized protein (DUF2249 family)/NAD-dependent dihydropyrimidine dehydrogenase PreA subunit